MLSFFKDGEKGDMEERGDKRREEEIKSENNSNNQSKALKPQIFDRQYHHLVW